MDNLGKKHCRKRLKMDIGGFSSDSESQTESDNIVKFTSGIRILSNVQVCPPSHGIERTNPADYSDSDSEFEIFPDPKRRKLQELENKGQQKTYVSPSSSKKFTVLENARFQANSPRQNYSPTDLLYSVSEQENKKGVSTYVKRTVYVKKNLVRSASKTPAVLRQTASLDNNIGPSSSTMQTGSTCKEPSSIDCAVAMPNLLLTPTQKFQQVDSNIHSQISTPDSISRFCTSSRCPSLNNISVLPLDETVSENNSLCKNTPAENIENVIRQKEKKEQQSTNENSENIKNRNEKNTPQAKSQQKNKKSTQEEGRMIESADNKEDTNKDIPSTQTNTINERESKSETSDESTFSDNDSESTSSVSSEIISSSSSSSASEDDDVQQDSDDEGWIDINEDVPEFSECTLRSEILIPTHDKTPIEIYDLFVTEEIVNKIVLETNNYAEKFLADNANKMKRNSRVKAWKPTDVKEMRRFFGVILVMGLNKVPHLNDYWSRKSIYRNDYICSLFPRDRFLLLLKFWHFSEPSLPETDDKLSKFREIYDLINKRFQDVLKPGKILVIDESMIPWRGRLKFRQYIKNKTHKYGVKLYKLCTPEGYTYRTIIYTGKEGNTREQDHGLKTVMKLVDELVDAGRTVVADNFYSSVGLAERLLARKTFYCGTLRSNRRGLPKKIVSTKVKKVQVCGKMNNNGVRIIKWCDKRQVLMLTTCKDHKAELVTTGKRSRATNEQIKKPLCVLMYNDNKKGIDYSDQMASYYSTLKRGLKWYRKVVMEFLFGTSLVNAWLIYNMSNQKKIPKKDFTECLIESLTDKKLCDTGTTDRNEENSEQKHIFEKGQTRKRCVGCYSKLRISLSGTLAAKKTKKILTRCSECKQALCLACFHERHK